MSTVPRLYVEAPLGPAQTFLLGPEQSHYLRTVLRRKPGDEILLFNGRDGEWRTRISLVAKRGVELSLEGESRPQRVVPDLWLIFAPVKKQRIDFIAEKAAEMGARVLLPVVTEHTAVERVNTDRLRAHAIEAAEQCGLLSVPEVRAPQPLGAVLDRWPGERRLLFCDESGAARPALEALRAETPGPWAVLIGPEGGFSDHERARLRTMPAARPVGLGPRILRADTAAVAALALWQAVLGDWGTAT